MAKKNIKTQEEIESDRFIFSLNQIQERVTDGLIPKNPTRLFNVGDEVKIGNLKNIFIKEVLFEGLAYVVHYDYIGSSYGRPVQVKGTGIWAWIDILPITSYCKGEVLYTQDDIRIQFLNNDISSLLSNVYNSGVDFNPKYQRDFVWNLDQKTALLDSIFNNVDIGKFTFIKNKYDENRSHYLQILDGKQRLNTLCEFYEDRFLWKGKLFSELCAIDCNHFTSFPIVQAQVSDITEQQIYKLFIKMNTTGVPVSKKDLDKVRSLIK